MVDRIGAGLLRLKQGMRGILWSVAGQAGLSSTQAQILLTLLASPAPLTAGALAAQLHVGAPALSEQLNALEDKGLLERRHCREDRRLVRVHLTETGETLAARLVGWDGRLAAAVRDLPSGDRDVFYRCLLSLVGVLEDEGLVGAHVCPACRYFCSPDDAEPGRPYQCSLTDLRMADADLRVDCPDFALRPHPMAP